MSEKELEGDALDRAVAEIEGRELAQRSDGLWARFLEDGPAVWMPWHPSIDWVTGGPIIERECIAVWPSAEYPWIASCQNGEWLGPTPLIAAMRAFVASKR